MVGVQNQGALGGFRKRFFPIYNHELKKALLSIAFFFLAALIYGSMRIMKDSYMVPLKGAEIIAYLKILVFFTMLFAKYLYDRMCRRVKLYNRMYVLIGCFVAFMVFFLVMKRYVAALANYGNLTTWQMLRCFWLYVLVYIVAELWGTFGLSIGCWHFMNEITKSEQAKRLYATLSLGTGLATAFAGFTSVYLVQQGLGQDYLAHIALGGMVVMLLLYHYYVTDIVRDPASYDLPKRKDRVAKKGKKLGVLASIKRAFAEKEALYILWIFVIVTCYGMAINLYEANYKDILKEVADQKVADGVYSSARSYVAWMGGWQLVWIGLLSIVVVLFLAAPVRRKGWRFAALVVPSLLFVGTVCFFGVCYFDDRLAVWSGWRSVDVRQGAVYVGVTVVICSKAAKYVFFDSTKEAAYLPLSKEARITGKSLADGVGGRLGKLLGSWYVIIITSDWVLVLFASSKEQVFRALDWIVTTGGLITLVIGLWVTALVKLNRAYQKKLRAREAEECG